MKIRFVHVVCLPLWVSWHLTAVHAVEIPAGCLSGLSSDDYKTREKAQKDLLAWARGNPVPGVVELLKISGQTEDPEVRERCLAVLRDLAEDDFQRTGSGYVGILMKDEFVQIPGENAQRSAIRVGQVIEGSAGHDAGLQLNDVIVGVDDEVWRDVPASLRFGEKIRGLRPGAKVTLKLLRDQKIDDVVITLRRRPLTAEPQFLFDPKAGEAAEKLEREAHFKKWLAEKTRKPVARD